jgi:hypothetical protein
MWGSLSPSGGHQPYLSHSFPSYRLRYGMYVVGLVPAP